MTLVFVLAVVVISLVLQLITFMVLYDVREWIETVGRELGVPPRGSMLRSKE